MSLSIPRTFAGAVVALFALQILALGIPPLGLVDEAEAQIITMPVTTTSPQFGFPGIPKFEHYEAPSSLPGHNSYGSRHLGISWKTDNVMVKSGVHTYRVVFDDSFVPAQDRWTDASYPLEVTGNLDNAVPIIDVALETNRNTGRTWTGSLASYYEGNTGCGNFAYSDDDGQHWVPMAIPCPQGLGMIQPTIASGPWWAPQHENLVYPEGVYYCSTLRTNPYTVTPGGPVAPVSEDIACAISYDGGATFQPAPGGSTAFFGAVTPAGSLVPRCEGVLDPVTAKMRPITTGQGKVGPDGALYLPNARCTDGSSDTNGALMFNASLIVSPFNANDLAWGFSPSFQDRPAPSCDGTTATLPNRAPGDQRAGLCGTGSFDPSVGISLVNETDGTYTIYFAQAEADGLYVGMSRDGGLTWEPQGAKNANAALNVNFSANILGGGTTYFPLSTLLQPNVIQEAELVSVVAGDEDRAAIVFLGSTVTGGEQRPGSRENDCGAGSDGHQWHLYVAFTFDGGQFWRLEQLTSALDPVQAGGIAERQYWPGSDPTDPTKLNAKCSNLRWGIDAEIDAEGRLHILYADGCRPQNGCPAQVNQSRDAWTTLARQQSGCGLVGRHDQPYPNACEIYMNSCAWYCRRPPIVPDRDQFVGITITVPADMTSVYPDLVPVRGQVTRQPVDPMAAQVFGAGPFIVGERFDLTTSITGGSGHYVCHWGSDRQVAVLDNDFCGGTGIIANATGLHRITLDVFDCATTWAAYNDTTIGCRPERNLRREFQVNVQPASGNCLDDPHVTDPQYDVWPYTHMVNAVGQDHVEEGSFRDIRRICVEDQGGVFTGFVTVRLGLQDLAPVSTGGGTQQDERDVTYAVRFCLNNHAPNLVCYAAQSAVDANGQRAVVGGVLAGGWATQPNPALHVAGVDLCPLPGLMTTATGNYVHAASDTVFFQFNKPSFDVTAPPADCSPGSITRLANAGIQAGTRVSDLRGGTEAPGEAAGVPPLAVDTAEGDFTDRRTGQQLNFTFLGPSTGGPLEADAQGVYRTQVNVPVAINGRARGGTGPVLQCEWAPRATAIGYLRPTATDLQFAGPDGKWACGATSVMFREPGLYWLDFKARSNLNSANARVARPCNACLENDTDPTLFYVAKPEQPWDEQVILLYDKGTPSACPAVPGGGNSRFVQVKNLVREEMFTSTYITLDTRTVGTAQFRSTLDLSQFDLGAPEVRASGTHNITAVWINGRTDPSDTPEERRILDCDRVRIVVLQPREGASPEGPLDPYARPNEGIDGPVSGLDEDEDGIVDGRDPCPGRISGDLDGDGNGDDLDGDGIGDECDPDADNDGVLNDADNCRQTANAIQADADLDGVGDACEGDTDGDGIRDGTDNCMFAPNPNQEDLDRDSWGNLCDADTDGDGVADVKDAFPEDGSEWRDTDRDGLGDNSDPDADGDGFLSTVELAAGSDPYDRRSVPAGTDPQGEDGPGAVAAARLKGGWLFLFIALGVVLLVGVVLSLLWMPRKN